MKLVLIKPRSETADSYRYLPLSLLCVGTLPKKDGFDVNIIDCDFFTDYWRVIEDTCRDAFIVGITVNTAQVREAIKISDFIKKRFNLPIVWGGWHPTLFPEQSCADKSVDFVIMNEGEVTFVELLKSIKDGDDYRNIDGLVYKRNGKIIKNKIREFLNIDELPPVNYNLIEINKYIGKKRVITYQSSRGCPYQCKFCINVVTGNNRDYRAKSPTKIIDDLQSLISQYGIRYVIFTDDNFFLRIKRVEEFCKELIGRGINIEWFAECRADYFRDGFLDQNLLKLAENSGLTSLTIGAESGSPEILKRVDKNITVADIIRSAQFLKNTKIVPAYSFIIGFNGEKYTDVLNTLELIKKLRDICPQMEYAINTLRAYPRSELTEELISSGYIKRIISLRDWLDKKKIRLYIGIQRQPWHFNSSLIYAVSRYSNLAANTYPEKTVRRMLKQIIPPLFIVGIIIRLAQLRMKKGFFLFKLDLLIFDIITKIKMIVLYSRVRKYMPSSLIDNLKSYIEE